MRLGLLVDYLMILIVVRRIRIITPLLLHKNLLWMNISYLRLYIPHLWLPISYLWYLWLNWLIRSIWIPCLSLFRWFLLVLYLEIILISFYKNILPRVFRQIRHLLLAIHFSFLFAQGFSFVPLRCLLYLYCGHRVPL